MNFDSLKNIDKKYLALGAIGLVAALLIFLLGPNTSFFKGSVTETEGETQPKEEITCEELGIQFAEVSELRIVVETDNLSNPDLIGAELRGEKLDEMAKFLSENKENTCETLSAEEKLLLSQKLESALRELNLYAQDIEDSSKITPKCPLENKESSQYTEFKAIQQANEDLSKLIGKINEVKQWTDTEYEQTSKLFVVFALLLDDFTLTDDTGEKITAIEAIRPEKVEAELLNKSIEKYNKSLEQKFLEEASCEYKPIPLLDEPVVCEEGTVFSDSSKTCVIDPETGNETDDSQIKSRSVDLDVCALNYTQLDGIYEILEKYKDASEDFGETQTEKIQAYIGELAEDYQTYFPNLATEFSYIEDNESIVIALNAVAADMNLNEVCSDEETKVYATIVLGSSEEESLVCPEGAVATSTEEGEEFCMCTESSEIIAEDGTCETDPDETKGDDGDEEVEDSCPEGSTLQTSDTISLCICDDTFEAVEPGDSCEIAPAETVVDDGNEGDGDGDDTGDTTDETEGDEGDGTDLVDCPDGTKALELSLCPAEQTAWVYTCEDGREVDNLSKCEDTTDVPYICADGITEVEDAADCPDPNLYTCPDGLTKVSSLSQCPSYDITAQNPDTTQDQYDETVFVDQDETNTSNVSPYNNNAAAVGYTADGPSLTTNTNPNIALAPEVQGDTGPGAAMNLMLLASSFGAVIIRKYKI